MRFLSMLRIVCIMQVAAVSIYREKVYIHMGDTLPCSRGFCQARVYVVPERGRGGVW